MYDKECRNFLPKVVGAPVNVCGAYTAYGGMSVLITKIGYNSFGDKIIEELECYHIKTDYILRTKKANEFCSKDVMKQGAISSYYF